MSLSIARALPVVAVLTLGPAVIAQQAPAPVPQVRVTGEVNRPGSIDWTPQLTVQAAIDATGGLTDRAAGISIRRRSGTWMTAFPGPLSRTLEPGDTLDIGRRPFAGSGPRVLVEGAVAVPGAYTLRSAQQPLAQAIAAAGGLTPDAGDDIQVWSRSGPPMGDQPPIEASTKAYEVLISHFSRRAIDEAGTFAGLYGDGRAVVVPRRDTTYVAGTATVVGDVRKPGPVHATRLGLRAVLVSAGGLTSAFADQYIAITRGTRDAEPPTSARESVSYRDIADGSLDLPLNDGDTVTIGGGHFLGGDFTSDLAGGGLRLLQWSTSRYSARPPGTGGTTAQEALNARNAQPAIPTDVPSAPLSIGNMVVERQTGDTLAVLQPTPRFILQPDDWVTVVKQPLDGAPLAPNPAAVAGTWWIDASRRMTLQVTGKTISGSLITDTTTTKLVGEVFGNLVALHAVGPMKTGSDESRAMAMVYLVYVGPRGALVANGEVLHAGVDGLRYLTHESWFGRRV